MFPIWIEVALRLLFDSGNLGLNVSSSDKYLFDFIVLFWIGLLFVILSKEKEESYV